MECTWHPATSHVPAMAKGEAKGVRGRYKVVCHQLTQARELGM